MMSHLSKKELLEVIRPRYLKATKKAKKQILDEFIAATGYHRKYAIRVPQHCGLKALFLLLELFCHLPFRAFSRGISVFILTVCFYYAFRMMFQLILSESF